MAGIKSLLKKNQKNPQEVSVCSLLEASGRRCSGQMVHLPAGQQPPNIKPAFALKRDRFLECPSRNADLNPNENLWQEVNTTFALQLI